MHTPNEDSGGMTLTNLQSHREGEHNTINIGFRVVSDRLYYCTFDWCSWARMNSAPKNDISVPVSNFD